MEKGSTDEWLSPKGAAKGKTPNQSNSKNKNKKSSSPSSSSTSASTSSASTSAVKSTSKSRLTTRQKSHKSDENLVQTVLVSPDQFASPPIRTTFTRHTKPVKLIPRTQMKIQDFFGAGKQPDKLRDQSPAHQHPEVVIEIPSNSEGEPEIPEIDEEEVEGGEEEEEEILLRLTRKPQPVRRKAPNFEFEIERNHHEDPKGGEDSSMEQFLLDFMDERESDLEVIEAEASGKIDKPTKTIHTTISEEGESKKRKKKRMPIRKQDEIPSKGKEENDEDDDVTEDESGEKAVPLGVVREAKPLALSESEYQGDDSSDDTLAPSPVKSMSIHAIPLIPIPKWSQESLSQPEGPSVSSQQYLKSDPESSPSFGIPLSRMRRSRLPEEAETHQQKPADHWDQLPHEVADPDTPFKKRKRVRIDDVDRVEESIQPGTQDSMRVLESPLITSPYSSPTKRQNLGGSLLVPETQEIMSSQECPPPKRRSVIVALETQGDFSMAMSFPQPPGWDSSDYHSPGGYSSQDQRSPSP